MNSLNHYNQPELPLFEKRQVLLGVINKLRGSNEKVTANDISSIAGLSDDEVIEVVNNNLHDDVRTEKGLDAFNYIFFKTLYVYSKTVGRNKKYKIDIGDYEEFETTEQIIDFLRTSEEDTVDGRIHCAIAKVGRAVEDYINTPMLQLLEGKMVEILLFLKTPLSLEAVGEGFRGSIGGGKKRIDFALVQRAKEELSSITKSTDDPKYDKTSELKDGVGFTAFTETWEESIRLMSIIISMLEIDDIEIKAKGESIKKVIEKVHNKLNPNIADMMTKLDVKKKSGTSAGYDDIKFTGKKGGIPIEFKFSIFSSENENGINFEPIFKGMKSSIEGGLIRTLNHYALEKDIAETASNLIDNIQGDIDRSPIKCGTEVSDYYRELWIDLKDMGHIERKIKWNNTPTLRGKKKLLKKGLTYYYLSKLNKVKLDSGEIVYINDRALSLSETNLYPKFIDAA